MSLARDEQRCKEAFIFYFFYYRKNKNTVQSKLLFKISHKDKTDRSKLASNAIREIAIELEVFRLIARTELTFHRRKKRNYFRNNQFPFSSFPFLFFFFFHSANIIRMKIREERKYEMRRSATVRGSERYLTTWSRKRKKGRKGGGR